MNKKQRYTKIAQALPSSDTMYQTARYLRVTRETDTLTITNHCMIITVKRGDDLVLTFDTCNRRDWLSDFMYKLTLIFNNTGMYSELI